MEQNELKWDKAKGSRVKIKGKWYIDFTSSIFSQNFGHNNPYMLREVRKQLRKCSHAYGYSTEIKEKFLDELRIHFPQNTRFLLFSTGAEANEAVIKIAIQNKYIPIGSRGAMHGRTTGTEALVGKRYNNQIDNSCYPGFPRVSGSNSDKKMAYFIEGYRGYDCRVLTPADIEMIRAVSADGVVSKSLIVFDEIQSGMYRTKDFLACLVYGICPDITVLGKSLGGGFPLSVVCIHNSSISLEGLELSSTHAGQPLQMAAGYGLLNYMRLFINNTKSSYSNNKKIIANFYGNLNIKYTKEESRDEESHCFGMVFALKVQDEDLFYRACFMRGLLVTKTGKGWIKVAPPVNISTKLLKRGLSILEELCS